MSYGTYMKELLRPLGVYRLEGTLNGAELESLGEAMDEIHRFLDEIHRQADLTTAGEEGLTAIERLFSRRPITKDQERRRAAIAALLRVGGDSFTLEAINDNLAGCGLNAVASEGEKTQTVSIHFPEVPGIPEGYEEMRKIIEDILPCHLGIEYLFWYVTWALMEQRYRTWAQLEGTGMSWEELEKSVAETKTVKGPQG